jgi:hypothetical protein
MIEADGVDRELRPRAIRIGPSRSERRGARLGSSKPGQECEGVIADPQQALVPVIEEHDQTLGAALRLYAANCVDGCRTVSTRSCSFRIRMARIQRNSGGAATPGAIKSLINHCGALENLRNHAPDVAGEQRISMEGGRSVSEEAEGLQGDPQGSGDSYENGVTGIMVVDRSATRSRAPHRV